MPPAAVAALGACVDVGVPPSPVPRAVLLSSCPPQIFAGYSPWLRLNRMVRILHLDSWFEDMTLHSRLYLQLRLVKLLGLLLVAFHVAACMYFMFVRIDG